MRQLTVPTAAAALAVLVLPAAPAAATPPVAPLPLAGDAPAAIPVSGGCGPFRHRGFNGFCYPGGGFYRPYGFRGYGYRPYGYRYGFRRYGYY